MFNYVFTPLYFQISKTSKVMSIVTAKKSIQIPHGYIKVYDTFLRVIPSFSLKYLISSQEQLLNFL